MPRYEYKIVPAPEKARKVRGLKGTALFALTLEDIMNELGADGWSYLRADVLPQEERAGLTSKTTTYRNLLVFQRDLIEEQAEPAPVAAPDPAPVEEPEDEEVVNIWEAPDAEEEDAPAEPLFPHRQSQRVDL